jgi:hypothetical protein
MGLRRKNHESVLNRFKRKNEKKTGHLGGVEAFCKYLDGSIGRG